MDRGKCPCWVWGVGSGDAGHGFFPLAMQRLKASHFMGKGVHVETVSSESTHNDAEPVVQPADGKVWGQFGATFGLILVLLLFEAINGVVHVQHWSLPCTC